MKKVAVIGHFGEGKNLTNGQTIKTKIVTRELERALGSEQVLKIDTHGGIKTYFKLPFQIIRALESSNNVIIFPAQNGVRIIAPLLVALNTLFRRNLHYIVIGGWLPDLTRKKSSLKKHLRKFSAIYVETNAMKVDLVEQGLSNIVMMPNFKSIEILNAKDLVYTSEEPFKVCTFSRVMKEKGIEDAVDAVKSINQNKIIPVLELDIYGQIESGQEEWFDNLMLLSPAYINYKGVVNYNCSTNILKDYFALLFPTYYEGEGFAGTLLDAFAAGVPVIATDWKYNSDIVNDAVGTVYKEKKDLAIILNQILANPDIWNKKKLKCIEEALRYKPDNVAKILLERLD